MVCQTCSQGQYSLDSPPPDDYSAPLAPVISPDTADTSKTRPSFLLPSPDQPTRQRQQQQPAVPDQAVHYHVHVADPGQLKDIEQQFVGGSAVQQQPLGQQVLYRQPPELYRPQPPELYRQPPELYHPRPPTVTYQKRLPTHKKIIPQVKNS